MSAPANDAYGNAQVLTGWSGSTAVDFTDSTGSDTGEAAWWGSSTHKSVWFIWTAPADGEVLFTFDSGAPGQWDLAIGPAEADFATWSGGVVGWGYQDDPSGCHMAVVSGQSYVVMADDYSYEQGDPPSTAAVLAWSAYVAPPPAPTAGTWTSNSGLGTHVLRSGDDATVAGTHLDVLDDVTVGGVSQSFTVISSTQIIVHIDGSAAPGPIVVSNSSGSDPATGNAAIWYPGPWIQPPDADAVDDSLTVFGRSYGDNVHGTTQPDFTGSPENGPSSYIAVVVQGAATPPSPDWQWTFYGSTVPIFGVGSGRDDFVMPPFDVSSVVAATPDAVGYENETATGVPLTETVDVSFNLHEVEGFHGEDTDNRNLSEDLWQLTVEFRRLGSGDYYIDTDGHRALTGDAWPSTTDLTALTLDSAPIIGSPVATFDLFSGGYMGDTDNQAIFTRGGTDDYTDTIAVDWSEYVGGMVWAVALSSFIDAVALSPPYMDPATPFTGAGVHYKQITGIPRVRVTFPYRPPRYRLFYSSPPSTGLAALRQFPRDDGLRRGPSRNQPTSRQGSLRRGPRGSYA